MMPAFGILLHLFISLAMLQCYLLVDEVKELLHALDELGLGGGGEDARALLHQLPQDHHCVLG